MNLHPKVKAGGITGVAYAVLVAVAAALGFEPSGLVLAILGAALPVVAGYLKASPPIVTPPVTSIGVLQEMAYKTGDVPPPVVVAPVVPPPTPPAA